MLQWLQKMERDFLSQIDINTSKCVFLIHLFWCTSFWENFHQKSFLVAGGIDIKSRWRPRNHSLKPPYLKHPQIPRRDYLFSVWCQGKVPTPERNQSLTFYFSKKSWKNILGDHIENFQSCTINHLCYKSITFSHEWTLGPFILLKSMIPRSPFFVRGLWLSRPFPMEVQKVRNICGIFTSTEYCDLFCSIILPLGTWIKMLTFIIVFYVIYNSN